MARDVPQEEQELLDRVEAALARRGPARARASAYDQELVALRDEIAEARLEDVPALVAHMERLQGISLERAEARSVLVDPASPYFGHLRLREQGPRGEIVRDVCIGRATFVDPETRTNVVDWRDAPVSQLYYRYEEGSDYEERFGQRDVEGEILARRTVTIEGGALLRVAAPQGVWTREADGGWRRDDEVHTELAGGQGIAARPAQARGVLGLSRGARTQRMDRHLPEIAALIDPRQFELITAPDSGIVVIQGGAGSGKTTIGLHRIAYLVYARPDRFPPRKTLVVTFGAALAAYIGEVLPALGVRGVLVQTFATWATRELGRAIPWLRFELVDDAPPVVTRAKTHPALLHELERRAKAKGVRRTTRAVVQLWAELLSDRAQLEALLGAAGGFTGAQIAEVHRFVSDRATAVMDVEPGQRDDDPVDAAAPDDEEERGSVGVDGVATERERPQLDLDDVALLLRAHQLVRGVPDKRRLAHLFVDEAQDLSPTALAALLAQAADPRSVTLAGDTAQRLFLDNGFDDWRAVLGHLGLAAVAIEPLKIAYRSTREILEVARHAMGPLADPDPPIAPRTGAPVEAHRFPGTGAAVAFVAEALRSLFAREPRASVAVIARHPAQADRWFDGLARSDVPSLRRIRAQEFAFRPGVEVTDVRQVKGLEWDYVLMVDVNANVFGGDDEARHLFHIAATRAAHGLWIIVTASPSPLVPPRLLSADPPPAAPATPSPPP